MEVKVTKLSYEKAVEDVEDISTQFPLSPIDPQIKKLLIGLIMWGVHTTMSCEGHPPSEGRGDRFGHPWVSVVKSDVYLLIELIQRQNRPVLLDGTPNTNKWAIIPSTADEVRLVPLNPERPLAQMQADADEFGEFLRELPDENLFPGGKNG